MMNGAKVWKRWSSEKKIRNLENPPGKNLDPEKVRISKNHLVKKLLNQQFDHHRFFLLNSESSAFLSGKRCFHTTHTLKIATKAAPNLPPALFRYNTFLELFQESCGAPTNPVPKNNTITL